MDFKNCLETRRSVRKYSADIIDLELVKEAIKLASLAPSWKNTECARFYLVQDKSKIDYIANNLVNDFSWNQNILLGTYNLIVIAAKRGLSGSKRDGSYDTNKENGYTMFDAGSATYGLTLALHNLGIGSCILGICNYEEIHSYLKLEEDIEVIGLLPFGYPLESPEMPKRNEIEKILKKL